MRPPFKLDHRPAVALSDRGPGVAGRASFVWLHGVVVALACGRTGVRIRLSGRPWHHVTATEGEAMEELRSRLPWTTGLIRQVETSRARRGLERLP